MKRIYFVGFLLALFSAFTGNAQRQAVGCMDKSIRLQADEIKQHYLKQGFEVYRDAMLNMESMTPAPVIVELQRGVMYQIIFVGTLDAYRLNFEMQDANENKLMEQFVFKNRQQPNYILANYTPDRTDQYLFLLLQKLKNRRMCGSFCILRMKETKQRVTITPYQ